MKDFMKLAGIFVAIAVFLWVACTSITYQFKHPEKTQMQAFLHIPKSMMLDFE